MQQFPYFPRRHLALNSRAAGRVISHKYSQIRASKSFGKTTPKKDSDSKVHLPSYMPATPSQYRLHALRASEQGILEADAGLIGLVGERQSGGGEESWVSGGK
jgi:hypothetical protein